MKKLLILALMAVLAMPTLRADEVRQHSGVYSPDPGYVDPAQTEALDAQAALESSNEVVPSRLAVQLQVLDAAAMAATTPAERQRLEEEMLLIKQNAERQRLEDRLSEAQSAGLNEEAARLSQLLLEFEGAGRPVEPGETIPRDVQSGEALDAGKGGAR